MIPSTPASLRNFALLQIVHARYGHAGFDPAIAKASVKEEHAQDEAQIELIFLETEDLLDTVSKKGFEFLKKFPLDKAHYLVRSCLEGKGFADINAAAEDVFAEAKRLLIEELQSKTEA